MKTTSRRNFFPNKFILMARTYVVAGFLFALLPTAKALFPDPGDGVTYTPLDTWSFHDSTNWTSDVGDLPVSFTNLSFSNLGDEYSLVVDSTNPAWLQYNIYETNGTTNLTVNAGSVAFWFAPNWSSTNEGGSGPGEWGRLIEVGGYSPDSSYGWWSLFVDDVGENIYFTAQTNDLSGTATTYLKAPISWTTNYWHYVVLTYCATNTAIYLDGQLATNGPPMTVYPGPDVLANGFYMGSDSNGVLQAQGMFNSVYTYNVPLDANTILANFNRNYGMYILNPWDSPYMANVVSAPSSPSASGTPDVITGSGYLQWVGMASDCVDEATNNIWITNVMTTTVANGTMNITFTIEGGTDGVFYDVFANSVLSFGTTGVPWAWMGQGYHCSTYMLTNLPNTACFLILGTPLDSDTNGLTDAYELLVSKTNPAIDDQDGAGISDGWQVLLELNPLVNQIAQPSTRANYIYDAADRLTQVSGVKTGTISQDNEGNVLEVTQ